MITIFTLTYNEEIFIKFMIDHYRSRFPECNIVVYDNKSTDKTVEIAEANNCEVRAYDSGGTLDDGLHMNMKNSIWKTANTNWVLVCDLDELLDINEQDLINEEKLGTTKINSEGWDMLNMEDNFDIGSIKFGVRSTMYDKLMLFNKQHIFETNYGAGCHDCHPIGIIKDSFKAYRMFHYKYINENFVVQRYKITASRLSEANKKNNWGHQTLMPEEDMRDYISKLKTMSVKIL
ncbi:MAG: glycosyltransferase family 2 protein [Nanoarchaeota archaeon]